MKKIKLLNAVLILFTAFTLTNCEEDGEIQFIVVDEFESNVLITGLNTTTSFETSGTTDVSDLLDNVSEFVDAQIDDVTLTLQDDYSGDDISGTFKITIGTVVFEDSLTLTKGVATKLTLPATSDIVSVINSGSFTYTVNANFTEAPADESFTLNIKFEIKATVQ